MHLGAFKADDEIFQLAILGNADPMPWVETGRDHTLILCHPPLEGGDELLASFWVGYDSPAHNLVSMEITFRCLLLVFRVQGQKFKSVRLFEYRGGRCWNPVFEVSAGTRELGRWARWRRWRASTTCNEQDRQEEQCRQLADELLVIRGCHREISQNVSRQS